MVRRYEIIADGKPRMGVNIDAVKAEGPVEGVKVVGVTPGSAADDAGLRTGDIITSINGDSMAAESWDEANRLVFDFMAGVEEGDILEVEYIRDGKVGTVEVEPRPVDVQTWAFRGMPKDFSMPEVHIAPEAAQELRNSFAFAWPGSVWSDMELVELSEGLGKYFGADSGVLVVSAPASDALQLEDGDVIVSIDGREPTSVKHALRILGSYQAGESLELSILREKKKRTLDIVIPDDRRGMLWEPAPAPRPAVAPRPAPAPKPPSQKT
jgi:S1-C subfamily serine protease